MQAMIVVVVVYMYQTSIADVKRCFILTQQTCQHHHQHHHLLDKDLHNDHTTLRNIPLSRPPPTSSHTSHLHLSNPRQTPPRNPPSLLDNLVVIIRSRFVVLQRHSQTDPKSHESGRGGVESCTLVEQVVASDADGGDHFATESNGIGYVWSMRWDGKSCLTVLLLMSGEWRSR